MATEKRLIDANEALRMMRNSKADNPCTDTIRKGVWNVAHDCAISCVEACPTVDAVEVVHGRWFFGTANHREYMKCSECLHSYTPDGTFCYCPNCGAKMDGDGNG